MDIQSLPIYAVRQEILAALTGGRVVKGTANTLRRAGVTVIGTGTIQIGPPQGTFLIFR